jgi:hypothetical protein
MGFPTTEENQDWLPPDANDSRSRTSPHDLQPRDPANQWLVLEPNRIEKQYWKVRYMQTLIGVAWAQIRPLLTMVVFTVIYSFGEGFAYGGWRS